MKIDSLIRQLIRENITPVLSWNPNPTIGWWLDNDPVRFYHGTHQRNLESILSSNLYAPSAGPTKDAVSLALEPNTAHGYASMSGAGGESQFRAEENKPVWTPHDERVVLVLEIPQSYFLSRMLPMRGAMKDQKNKLTDPVMYEQFVKENGKNLDFKYYEMTEIRLPKEVPGHFIVGWTKKLKFIKI